MEQMTVYTGGGAIANTRTIDGSLFDRFISYLDAKPKTVETYSRALRQFFRFMDERGISAPTREDVIAYREYLKAGHSAATVQSYIVAVRLFFRWTEQEGIYKNIADHIKGAKLNRAHSKGYLTSRQARAILADQERDTLKGKRDYALLALMLTGGLRTIEVARANIEDVGTEGDSTVLYVQGKGRDDRTEYVKLMPAVEEAIRDYLKARGRVELSAPLFASISKNNEGGRMTTRAISGIAKGAMIAAGYDSDRLTAHSFRHTAVTLSLMGGATLQEAQQFARHRDIATTTIYAHNLERAKNPCGELIARSIF